MKASNFSWHVGRRYSEDQLMEVRSAVNVRLVSAVTCRVVVIVFEHGRCFHVVPMQGIAVIILWSAMPKREQISGVG